MSPFSRRILLSLVVATVLLCSGCAEDLPLEFSPTFTVDQPQDPIAEARQELGGLLIDDFFEESFRLLMLRDPDRVIELGLDDRYQLETTRFSDRSPEYLEQTYRLEALVLELLLAYDRQSMTAEQHLSFDIYRWYLEDLLAGQTYVYYDYPVNPLTVWGEQNWLVDFFQNNLPLATREDAAAYISRLEQVGTWAQQLIEGLQTRADMRVVPPTFLIDAAIGQIDDTLALNPDGSPNVDVVPVFSYFLTQITSVPGLSPGEIQDLEERARTAVEENFIPAYLALRDVLVVLSENSTDDLGVCKFPAGDDYYLYALEHHTTTGMHPEEVYALGLAEISRIDAQIHALAQSLGLPDNLSLEEIDALITAGSPVLQGDALADRFTGLISQAEQAAGDYFGRLPTARVRLQTEPYGSLAYYEPPPFGSGQDGMFYVNLSAPLPDYLAPVLVFHETIPGHHTQGALSREMDLPTFRQVVTFEAYVEGWALYAERLADEMGLYGDDPAYQYGRLVMERMRAVRLLIDVGIHYYGWDFEQLAAEIERITGDSISRDSLVRYLVLPGQACSYTIGYLKILELRQYAEEQLADEFDLSDFHDLILGSGPMPLEIMEQVVLDWVAGQLP